MYAYRKVSFVMFWKMPEEVYGDNELQHRVSEEFHSLVTATEVKKWKIWKMSKMNLDCHGSDHEIEKNRIFTFNQGGK